MGRIRFDMRSLNRTASQIFVGIAVVYGAFGCALLAALIFSQVFCP